VDAVLLVAEWGKVSTDELDAALALAAPVRERLIGTVLNKAAMSRKYRLLSPEAAILARQSAFAAAAGKDRGH
ncbi:hypothetical protein AB4144_04750, partial [Rhizobiaceae sp. 2RAB30]